MARSFAFTLVPIAIGYHLAHYLTFLLVQGQYIIPLLSDPFGWGWNLFGTAGYRVDIAIVGARFSWYAAVLAILIGHIAAVYLAHRQAMRVMNDRVNALRSQAAADRADGGLHLHQPVDPGRADRRAPHDRAARRSPDEITVPADAVLPDTAGRLQPVGAGKIARQKLTYRVLGSAFHDGTRTNAADLLYSLMFAYRWSADDGDPFVASATAAMRRQLIGIRVLGVDATSKSFRIGDVDFVREIIAVDVYGALAPIDPEQDAAIAPPWSTLPWHLVVLMEEAVGRGWGAFSQAEAARRGVEWLDLVRSEPVKKKLAALVETFERDGYRPLSLQALVSVEDARKRWAALAAFHKANGHFLVSNGPYRLKAWSAQSVSLEAFRDLTYPLGVGSYDSYAVPRRGFVTKVERQNERVRLFADIELLMKHQRSYDLVRKPLQSIPRDVLARSAPQCRYTVVDENGRVVLAGTAGLGSDPGFLLDLSGKLPRGRFTLLAQIVVNSNAMNAEIERIHFLLRRHDGDPAEAKPTGRLRHRCAPGFGLFVGITWVIIASPVRQRRQFFVDIPREASMSQKTDVKVDRRKFLAGAGVTVAGAATAVPTPERVANAATPPAGVEPRRVPSALPPSAKVAAAEAGIPKAVAKSKGSLFLRLHGRCDQVPGHRLHPVESSLELPCLARVAGQLRRQQEARVPHLHARGVRGRDGPRLFQGHRQADVDALSRHGRPAACVHGRLQRLVRSGAGHRRRRQ